MANRYFKSGATLWNNANSWSVSASTGSDNAGIPSAADVAIFDANSGACTVSGVAANCLSLTLTGYLNTITMNTTISVATTGTLTLGTTAVSVAGASALILVGNNTLTSGAGGHWGGLISFQTAAGVKTLSSNFSTNSLTITNASTVNGAFNLIISGGTFTVTSTITAGASVPTFVLNGTSTITGAGNLPGNLTFSGSGTITFSYSGFKVGGTITTVSGVTVNTAGSTLLPSFTSMPIFDTQYMTWTNLSLTSTSPVIFQMLSNLNISGTTTLNSATGLSFSGAGLFNPTGTLTLSGNHTVAFPNTLNLTILNITTANVLSNSVTINTQSFSGTANLTTTSTPTLVFTGTGVWNSSGQIGINTIINSVQTTFQNTSTFSAGAARALTYSGGTVITSGNTFVIGGTQTVNTNGSSSNGATTTSSTGINFNNLNLAGGAILTLTSNLCAVTSFSSNTATITSASNSIYIGGNLTLIGNVTGTAPIVMNGTGTWSGNFSLQKNISFNTSGTITLSGLLQYGPGTMTYTAGIINVGTSTISIVSNVTIDGSMTFWNLNIGSSPTITINTSSPTINNTLLLSGSTIFTSSGTVGFTAKNFSSTTANLTHTLKTGTTYSVSSSLILTGTSAGIVTLKSSNTSGATFFNLAYGATQQVAFVTATDINSSGGQTIWDFKGVLTRTTNWNLLTTPITLAKTFVY